MNDKKKSGITPVPKPIAILLTIVGCFFLGAVVVGITQGIVLFFDKYAQPLWAWWLWATIFGLILFYGFKYFARLYNKK